MSLTSRIFMTVLICGTSFTALAETPPSNPALLFEKHAQDWRNKSCLNTDTKLETPTIKITATSVPLGLDADVADKLPSNVRFTGGWNLTSDLKEFGGLSGLALTETGDLLAVSDMGHFVTIGLKDGTPNGTAQIFAMRGEDGELLSGKKETDAEGLTYRDGLALVSFERDNRILAFDLLNCQSAARGVHVTALPNQFSGQDIASNQGPEALEFSDAGSLHVGYESTFGLVSWVLAVNAEGGVNDMPQRIPTPLTFNLVGLSNDMALFRAYDRIRGNQSLIKDIRLSEHEGAQLEPPVLLRLAPPLNVDNFEGITTFLTSSGTRIVYIISDNNFSKRQRTLLYRFEIDL